MSVGYAVWVMVGVLAAMLAAWWQPSSVAVPANARQALSLAAFAGAVLGAFGLQLPADVLGWHAPPPPGVHADPLGGRTVLGGLLGGWLAVELMKKVARVRVPTGGDFALPLALALGFGRLGCIAAGCCAGVVCDPGLLAMADVDGTPRVPTQAIEAAFHFAAATLLAFAAWRGRWPTTRLPAYVAAYSCLRFVVEFWRQHPPVLAGLTYYQWLCLALLLLTATVWAKRANGTRFLLGCFSRPR